MMGHRDRMLAVLVAATAGFWPMLARAQDADTIGEEVVPPSEIMAGIFASTSEALFVLLAGAAIPWAVAMIILFVGRMSNQTWGPLIRQVAVFLVCLVAAAIYLFVADDQTILAWDGLPRLFIILAMIAYGFFRVYRKPIDAIEDRPAPPPEPAATA